MSNTIKYLDQKGLKNFHDATGWVNITLGANQSITHYTNSPVKFPDGGKVSINKGTEIEVTPLQKMMLYKNATIMSKTPITISVFVNEYNQLIQHKFKTNEIESNSGSFKLDGSSLIFKNVDGGETRFGVYTYKETDPNTILGINTNDKYLQVSNTTNATTITPTKITSTDLSLVGDATIAGNLVLAGNENQVILGDGTPKKLEELIVGKATNATNAITADEATKATNADKVKVVKNDGQYWGGEYRNGSMYIPGYYIGDEESDYKKLLTTGRTYISTDKLATGYVDTLVTDNLLLPEGDEYSVLLGNGSQKALSELEVGNTDKVKVTNAEPVENSKLHLLGSNGTSGEYNNIYRRTSVYITQTNNEDQGFKQNDVLVTPRIWLSQRTQIQDPLEYESNEVVPKSWIVNYINTMTYDGNLEKDIFTQTTT